MRSVPLVALSFVLGLAIAVLPDGGRAAGGGGGGMGGPSPGGIGGQGGAELTELFARREN